VTEQESFRFSRKFFWYGVLGMILFPAMTVGALIADPTECRCDRQHAVGGLIAIELIPAAMTLLSACLVAAFYREQITIAGTEISIQSVFGRRQLDASQIEQIDWRPLPAGGRIVLRSPARQTKLELGNFSVLDRLRLIRRCRALVPPEMQNGWPTFCHKIALPLRDQRLFPKSLDPAVLAARGEMLITRRRYDRVAQLVLPIVSIVSVAVWWITGSPILFVYLGFLAFVWVLVRYLVRREGYVEAIPRSPRWPGCLAAAAWCLSMLTMATLRMVDFSPNESCFAALVTFLCLFPIAAVGLCRAGKQEKIAAAAAELSAPSEWNEGEPVHPVV